MHRNVRGALGALTVAATLVAPALVAAQTPSLVGTWSTRRVTQQGTVAVVFDQFDANGNVHVRAVNPGITMDYVGVYQLLNNGSVIQSRINDYSPKQFCTMVCSPTRPELAIGVVDTAPLRFEGPNVMFIGNDGPYTRMQ
jgi:hypothetical protein